MALGNLAADDLRDFKRLPHAVSASHRELMDMIEAQAIRGSGVGYVDAHLIAATRLTNGALLWTRDKRLRRLADRLSVCAVNLD